jgi:PilZ domain
MATDTRIATPPPETRRWRRYQLTVPVRVMIEKSRHVSVINSHGYQVNAGGLAFFADADLEIGDEVEIALTDYGLTLRGVVRNRANTQYGVKFLATSPDEAEQLGLFRKNLSSKMGRLDA